MITLTKDDIIKAVKAHGWSQLWHDDNWVHSSATDPDHAGHSLIQAFALVMLASNILSYQTTLERAAERWI